MSNKSKRDKSETIERHRQEDTKYDESNEAEEALKALQGPLGGGDGFLYYKNGKLYRSDGKRRWGWWWI